MYRSDTFGMNIDLRIRHDLIINVGGDGSEIKTREMDENAILCDHRLQAAVQFLLECQDVRINPEFADGVITCVAVNIADRPDVVKSIRIHSKL